MRGSKSAGRKSIAVAAYTIVKITDAKVADSTGASTRADDGDEVQGDLQRGHGRGAGRGGPRAP